MVPGQPPVQLVAKIFDPRFYRWKGDGLRNTFASYLVEEVTLDYSHEAAAYERIEAHKSTRPHRCTPDYFGSWSFDIEEIDTSGSGPARRRKTHLILIEHINGRSLEIMDTLEIKTLLGEEYRLYACARYCECEVWLEHIGV